MPVIECRSLDAGHWMPVIAPPNIESRLLNPGHWMPAMALQQSLHSNLRHRTGMASEHLNLDLNLLPHL
jgi:hypothetical protein